DHLAGCAPVGVEVDEHGLARLHHGRLEVLLEELHGTVEEHGAGALAAAWTVGRPGQVDAVERRAEPAAQCDHARTLGRAGLRDHPRAAATLPCPVSGTRTSGAGWPGGRSRARR